MPCWQHHKFSDSVLTSQNLTDQISSEIINYKCCIYNNFLCFLYVRYNSGIEFLSDRFKDKKNIELTGKIILNGKENCN